MSIDYYTTGDGEELCIGCAVERYGSEPLRDEDDDEDENGIACSVFDGWGGPVFTWDEGSTDRDTVCDDCGGVIREHDDDDDDDC